MNSKFANYSTAHLRFLNLVIFLGLVCSSALQTANAQVTTATNDGTTPSGIAPGAPVGSFALSGFEQINNYNGRLSVNLPLHGVGGRGSTGYTIPLSINARPWIISSTSYIPTGSVQVYWYHTPAEYFSGLEPGYGPGVLQLRRSGENAYKEPNDGKYYYYNTLTRITFTEPNGTEIELIDQLTNGQRQSGTGIPDGFNRGKTFITRDGGSATYISDFDIYDRCDTNASGFWPDGGYLHLKDGSLYRIDGGRVTWARDRNGNKTTYTYDATDRILTATDSLNRQVTFAYNVNAGYPYGICDEITSRGTGGATRTIRISRTNLSNALKSGELIRNYSYLFPELPQGGGALYNPSDIASTVWLPDGRYYTFKYNSYGEVARIELPTGGAFEYDYQSGSTTGPASGTVGNYSDILPLSPLPRLGIYRRVKERRVYANGSILEGKTVYDRPTISAGNTIAEVRQYDSGGTQLMGERHYYHSNPETTILSDSPSYLSSLLDGKEYKTESLSVSGTVLRRSDNNWGTGVAILDTTSTLADTNQVSKTTYAYDSYNNQTDTYEYDFGTGIPGSFVRRTHTDFATTVNGVNYATDTSIHIRNLPIAQKVYSDAAGTVKKAETTFEYDNYSAAANHAGLVNRANISGLDAAFTTTYTRRGNPTAVSRWKNTDNTYINTYAQYDIAGNVVKAIDALNNASTLDFADNFGAPDGEARTTTAPTMWLAGQTTFAFPTKVTNAAGHIAYAQVDYYTGKPVDTEDPNSIKASLYYGDALDRLTKGINAVGTALQ